MLRLQEPTRRGYCQGRAACKRTGWKHTLHAFILFRSKQWADISPPPCCAPLHGPVRSEQRYEEQLPQGNRKAWKSESVSYSAVPTSSAQLPHQPMELSAPWLFAVAAFVGVWGVVSAAFWRYYNKEG